MGLTVARSRSLCSTCIACITKDVGFVQRLREEHVYRHHRTVASWQASIEAVCFICTALWRTLSIEEQEIVEGIQGELRLTMLCVEYRDQSNDLQPLRLRVFVHILPEIARLGENRMCTYVLDPTRDAALAYLSHLPGISTFESLSLGKEWLKSCCEKHEVCQTERTRWLPTRLLKISKDQIRLVLTSRLLRWRRPKYATLSHCWGDAQNLKLENSTFRMLRKGVHLNQLPPTFKHAAQVAQYLDIEYLWIDSLCIIQGDQQDWTKEALLMYKVYSKSHINITATAAWNSGDGLFFTRDPETEFSPVRLTLPASCRSAGGIETTYTLVSCLGLRRDLESAPLTQRGWALQERLLAPRVLHFGSKQLIWQCQEQLLCEQHPNQMPKHTDVTSLVLLKQAFAKNRTVTPSFDIYWQNLVREYTKCSLSVESDKSIAFSGIVKFMQTKYGDDYIAGMWGKLLPWWLTWSVEQEGREFRARPQYRAPSWSWLSVDGNIMFNTPNFPDDTLQIEVLKVDLKYAGSDPTGHIVSGSLLLRGTLRQVKILVRNEDEKVYRLRFTLVLESGPLLESQKYLEILPDITLLDFEVNNSRNELYMMVCWGPGLSLLCALLLKCVDATEGKFERVGALRFAVNEDEALLSKIMEHDGDENSMPCINFDPIKRQHTILII